MDARRAVSGVGPGQTVVLGGFAGEPQLLVKALADRAATVGDIRVLSGMLLSGYGFLNQPALRYETWFMPTSLLGHRLPAGRVRFLPLSWSQVFHYLEETQIDVALVQVSPADDNGFHSLGVSTSHTLPAIRVARQVIAEVNPRMPRSGGAALVHTSKFDALVPVEYELPEFPVRTVGVRGAEAARNAASLVPSKAVVQPGIGAIPNEVMRLLGKRPRGVRIHSLLTDACMEIVDDRSRRSDVVATVGEIIGSRQLYDWVDRHPAVRMVSAAETHSLRALLGIGAFVSINSALQVDLFGQANLELVGGIQVGGVGGSADFMTAASQPGSTPILVLPSRTSQGLTRIVPSLTSPVSLPRWLIQIVVTEHGVADLRGMDVEQRAARLIEVADPEDRPALKQAWLTLS